MSEYKEQSQKQSAKAWTIIQSLKLIEVWENIEAKVNLVGSLKIGVLAKHRDIDFHIYTNQLDVKTSFNVVAELCANPQVKKCEFINLADTEESCLEWHIWYSDEEDNLWQIDMIQIKSGSKYDGYFEKVAEQIGSQMTEKQKEIILKLKYETPNDVKISGIEYYKAVIQDNIETYDELLCWRENHRFSGVIEW